MKRKTSKPKMYYIISTIYNEIFLSKRERVRVRVMVFNATFNNISVISWWSVLLVEETGVTPTT
jgi:hypothetical protein